MLHRPLTVAAALLLCVLTLSAQHPKRSTGPRALGLVQVAQNGRARLIPISILINGKFFDADAYHADPLPMALEPETVYEAFRSGESVGLFTLTNAVTVGKNWFGLGQWRTNASIEQEKKAKAAAEAAETAAAAAKPADDEPPVLRKQKAQSASEPAPKPEASKPPEPKPAAKTEAKAAPAPRPSADDPDRPLLRRGRPADTLAEDGTDPFTQPKRGAKSVVAGGPVEILPAISDADGPEIRSYLMQVSPEERQKYEAKIRAAAYDAIVKFAAARRQHKPAAAAALRDVQFKVFDVHHNNEPVLVMSASLPEQTMGGSLQYFVTVVSRIDMYGDMHRLLAEVSDTSHLDVYRRMELIDAVDAQGTGSGQLLFRAVGDADFRYTLYRVGSDQLWPLFESAPQELVH